VRNDIIAQGEIQTKGGITALGSGLFDQGISSFTAEQGGQAVLGWATDTVGANLGGLFRADGAGGSGVYGYAAGAGGYGVYGNAADTSATANYGGYFIAGGNNGSYGVYAQTQAEWGYGVFGTSVPLGPATAGIGVGGVTTGTATGSSGVNGQANGAGTVYGVYGLAGDSGGGVANYGGYFQAGGQGGGRGVYGFASGAGGTNYGVYGQVTSAVGYAGYFTGGYGVYANRENIGRLPTGDDTSYGLVVEGAACIDDSTANCPAGPTSGTIYTEGAALISFDLAELYESSEALEAGDVVSADLNNDKMIVKSNSAYGKEVLGVVSTKPGIILGGWGAEPNQFPVALAGRVPVKVSTENGPIKIGDKLTSSNTPGVAMKATEAGAIIGLALEPYNGVGVGKITVFVNVDWSGAMPTAEIATVTPATSSGYTQFSNQLTADLDADGFAIINVSKIVSKDEIWSIDENGVLTTKIAVPDSGTYDPNRDPAAPKYKDVFGLSSTQVEVVLSGSAKLEKGEALVDFNLIDPDFVKIVDPDVALKIYVTPTEICQGLYVAEKYPQGFKVKELGSGTSDASFDWIVVGKRLFPEQAAGGELSAGQ
jgi:hypothetical protein